MAREPRDWTELVVFILVALVLVAAVVLSTGCTVVERGCTHRTEVTTSCTDGRTVIIHRPAVP